VQISYAANIIIHRTGQYGIHGKLSSFNAPAKTVLLLEMSGGQANVSVSDEAASSFSAGHTPVSQGVGIYNNTAGGQVPNTNPPSVIFATGYMGGRGSGGGAQYTNPNGRHLEGSNFAFADGHAKWLKGDTVSTGAAMPCTDDLDQDATANPTCPSVAGLVNNHPAGTAVSRWAATFSPI
jgi:prepilin-type processing-associated H-X9-DG protein